ncbi:hypothetical protein HPB52_013195 [Rhipicephalus sanguineus]|uniref:Uncharacterized protein n=1 Tax=Rhipicephalus sanguineus TaxID=34632 RepID=A0A9D4TA59_RHISA|nr:hypothetical protein HPB52_013195 [Rhipicephalus sanguineus]
MEGTMPNTSEPKARHAAARADSGRSLSCFSVDENVQDLLWDEDVQMEELLDFSFDHIDKLAERRGKTITIAEKWRLWDYVQRMKREQPYWITKESVPWDELEAKYALHSRSLSSDSLRGDLQFSRRDHWRGRGRQLLVVLPLLRRVFESNASRLSTAPSDELKCKPDERFTLSEQWDAGSPHRDHVVSAACPKKKQGWQRLLGKVFHPKPKSSAKDHSIADLDSTFAAASNSSSPCSRYEGPPSPPTIFQKQRPTGFLRRSLRKVTMAARKHD